MGTKTKHTPGPWELTDLDNYPEAEFCINAVATPYSLIAECFSGSDEQRLANARLIAAAPDLLEICEIVLARLDLEPVNAVFPNSAMRSTLRAAIAMAKGE